MIVKFISDRKKELEKAKGEFADSDFLSMMIQDDYFKQNEQALVDECIGIMIAST